MPAEVKPEPEAPDSAQTREPSGQGNAAAADASLLDLVADMIALARQTWRDRFALAKAEAELAFGSLLLLLGLVFALAMTLILVWVLLLAAVGYAALKLGVSGAWVMGGLIVAQLILAWYLQKKIRQVASWLSFPETRRSLSSLPPSPPASKESGKPNANSEQRPGGATQ